MWRFLVQAQRHLSEVKGLVSILHRKTGVGKSMHVYIYMHIAYKYMSICILNGGAIFQAKY